MSLLIAFAAGCLFATIGLLALLLAGLSYQGWIAFDQYLSCRLNKFAMADEAYSARVWRRKDDPVCAKRVKQIDWFFTKYMGQKDHCLKAYLSELRGSQNHPDYRKPKE